MDGPDWWTDFVDKSMVLAHAGGTMGLTISQRSRPGP
jgi:hypothetical protein